VEEFRASAPDSERRRRDLRAGLGAKVESAQGLTGLGKYLMRSPTREVLFEGESMRFSKVRRNAPGKKYIYISIYNITGWLLFMQKKRQNGIGFPLIKKEGR